MTRLCNTKYFDRQKLFPHDTPDTKIIPTKNKMAGFLVGN